MIRAGLAAATYLLRHHDWNTASYVLEQARIRDDYSPVTAHAVIAPLRRIAEATGEPNHFRVLAAALRTMDPSEAEVLLRRVYDQATTGDHRLSSETARELAILLRYQGRLGEALTVVDQRIEHIRQAGLGSWTELGGQVQRLQILAGLGHHGQVLIDLPALRVRMAELPDQPADNDTANPWNVRELILDVGSWSASILGRWQEALELNDEAITCERRRGASLHETSGTRFNNYGPLLRLGRLDDADQLLRDCQDVFDTYGDITMLGMVFSARAGLEKERGHLLEAVELERTSLRLSYIHPEPSGIAVSHYELAYYLYRTAANPAEQRAHRLAAVLLCQLTGDTHHLTDALRVLAGEFQRDSSGPDTPVLPTDLPEVIRLVDAGDGVRFGDLIATLCPDPDTADQALTDLLATAATLPDDCLSEWEPVVTAVVDAATSGHTPTELVDHLDERGATTDWAALAAALRRVLVGDRDLEQLLAGLDGIDTAILTAVLDRLPTSPGQDP